MREAPIDTHSKALKINLDPRWYGTFAEIGAGQEVVRWFFRVGGAAGTVAKSMSAYDMQVSDAIYGHADRYVSRGRLQAMLDREFDLGASHSASLEITVVPALARRDSIDVSGKAAPVEQGATTPAQIDGRTAKQLPNKPATVADAYGAIAAASVARASV